MKLRPAGRYFIPLSVWARTPFRLLGSRVSDSRCSCPDSALLPARRHGRPTNLSFCKHISVLKRLWSACRLVLIAITPSSDSGFKLTTRRGRSTACAIERLRLWLVKAVHHEGVRWTCKQIKSFSNWCRWRSLAETPLSELPRGVTRGRVPDICQGLYRVILHDPLQFRDSYAQLARLGRACPEPCGPDGKKEMDSAIRDHYNRYTSTAVTEPRIRRLFRSWTVDWVRRRSVRPKDDPQTMLSKSAAAEFSLLKGGQVEDIRQRFSHRFLHLARLASKDDPAFEHLDPETRALFEADVLASTYSEAEDIRTLVEWCLDESELHWFARQRRLGELLAFDENPEMPAARADDIREFDEPHYRVMVLPELGWKTRVITAPAGYLTVAGNAVRRALWPLLMDDDRLDVAERDLCDTGLASTDRIRLAMGSTAILEGYSGDLTAATDLIPLDLVESMVSGLLAGLHIPNDCRFARLLRLFLGPAILDYPQGVALPGPRTVENLGRGILMGSPLSWFFLCLFNLACADLAVLGFSPEESASRRRWRESDRSGCAAVSIRGDDIAGLMPESAITAYEAFITSTGGIVNRSKSVRSFEGFLYAEKTFIIVRSTSGRTPVGDVLGNMRNILDPHRVGELLVAAANRGTVGGIYMLDDVPVRHFVPSTEHTGMPWYHRLGPASSAVIYEHCEVSSTRSPGSVIFKISKRRRRLCRALLAENVDLIRRCTALGIPIFVPRDLGGLGLPHPRGFGAGIVSRAEYSKLAALRMTLTGVSRGRCHIDRDPWAPKGDRVERDAAERWIDAEETRVRSGFYSRGNHTLQQEGGGMSDSLVPESWEERVEPDFGRTRTSRDLGAITYIPLSQRVWTDRESAITEVAKTGASWAGAVLGPRPDLSRWPTLPQIGKGLTGLLATVRKLKFNQQFLPSRKLTRARYLDRVKMARGAEGVYLNPPRRNEWQANLGYLVPAGRETGRPKGRSAPPRAESKHAESSLSPPPAAATDRTVWTFVEPHLPAFRDDQAVAEGWEPADADEAAWALEARFLDRA